MAFSVYGNGVAATTAPGALVGVAADHDKEGDAMLETEGGVTYDAALSGRERGVVRDDEDGFAGRVLCDGVVVESCGLTTTDGRAFFDVVYTVLSAILPTSRNGDASISSASIMLAMR